MSDLISKNELYKKGESLLNSFINGKKNGEQAFRDLFNAIADMPTVDTVKHGHWEKARYDDYKCSNCGHCEATIDEFEQPMYEGKDDFLEENKYCRNCGAKMDEVTEDDKQ